MQHPLTQLAQDVRTGQDRQHFWNFVIPAVATALGALAGGRSKGKQDAAQTNLQRDQLATQQYQTQQNALLQSMLAAANQQTQNAQTDLAQRQFTLNAPNQRAATSVRGDIMARAQPLSINFQKGQIPTFSGGASLASLSPESRQIGQSLSRNALLQQMQGDTFKPLETQNWQGAVLQPPQQTPLPQSNWLDKTLGVLSPIASIAGAVSSGVQQSKDNDLIMSLLQQAGKPGAMAPQPMAMPQGWALPKGTLQDPWSDTNWAAGS